MIWNYFEKPMPTGALNVLFLSDRNAAYGIMAEAILRVDGNGRFRPYSAAIEPAAAINAEVIDFLAARDLPVEGLRAKGVHELHAPVFHFIITLSCAAALFAEGRAWEGDPVIAHWALDAEEHDPEDDGSASAIRDAFWTLSRRIRILASLPHHKATRRSLENRLYALRAM